jgi:hypothetical protein
MSKRKTETCKCGRTVSTQFEWISGWRVDRTWAIECPCGIETGIHYSARAAWAEWRKLQESQVVMDAVIQDNRNRDPRMPWLRAGWQVD